MAPPSSSLSNVVSSLVRAQYGLTARENDSNETDLDRHVAELLLKEAKEREARARRDNVGYWRLSDDEDDQYQSKTNKRFLKNVLRNVEDHNTLLRKQQQQQSASSSKVDLDKIRRREREARERRTGVRESDRAHHRGSHVDGSGRPAPSASSSLSVSRRVRERSEPRDGDNEGGTRDDDDFARSERERSPVGGEAPRPVTSQEIAKSRSGYAPGFAARSLALGGLRPTRGETARKEEQQNGSPNRFRPDLHSKDRAVSREKAEFSRSSRDSARDHSYEQDVKGKGRAGHDDEQQYDGSERSRGPSSARQDEGRRGEGSRRDRSPPHSRTSENVKRRRRSESPNGRSRSRYHTVRDEKDQQVLTSRWHKNQGSERSLSKDASPNRRREDPAGKRGRARSASASSAADTATSDEFIDVTGLSHSGQVIGASNRAAALSSSSSKMDKYFSPDYQPALDVSISDLTDPTTGLIGEGNFSEWDRMLDVLKKRKEDKVFGVSRAKEEERERQLRKLERKKRREERELRRASRRRGGETEEEDESGGGESLKEKKRKRKSSRRRRRGGSDRDNGSSDTDTDEAGRKKASAKKRSEPATINVGGFEYARRGVTRAWDIGKENAV